MRAVNFCNATSIFKKILQSSAIFLDFKARIVWLKSWIEARNKGSWSVVGLRRWSTWQQETRGWPFVALSKATAHESDSEYISLHVTSISTSPSPDITPSTMNIIPDVEQRALLSVTSVLSSPRISLLMLNNAERVASRLLNTESN